jgi:hypothetical protein
MFLLSDLFRDYLIVFLEASFIALGVLFAYVLVRHAVSSWREQRDATCARSTSRMSTPCSRRQARPISSRPSRGSVGAATTCPRLARC